ncbi:MAG: hypothetical protein JNG88_10505 [Phycisphaerales bacterium]|nr:hypothetical protein [Phycisphaerales bacterium]
MHGSLFATSSVMRAEHTNVRNVQVESSAEAETRAFQPLTAVGGVRTPLGVLIVAVGGELKSAPCLAAGHDVRLYPVLGDLSESGTFREFAALLEQTVEREVADTLVIACDAHPNYGSSNHARELARRLRRQGRRVELLTIQHHHAHIAGVMAEHDERGPLIGLACDGTGFGASGGIWGGELLLCEKDCYRRIGHLAEFPLIGGDSAAIETWRPALALLRLALGDDWRVRIARDAPLLNDRLERVGEARLEIAGRMAESGVNSPACTSLGRLFDAAAFLLGVCDRNTHEGEAAIALEQSATSATVAHAASIAPWPYEIRPTPAAASAAEHGHTIQMSFVPALIQMIADIERRVPANALSARFHETVSHMLADGAERACANAGVGAVALSGGCFANHLLMSRVRELLEGRGLRVLYNLSTSCGDAGLAIGQAFVAAWRARAMFGD